MSYRFLSVVWSFLVAVTPGPLLASSSGITDFSGNPATSAGSYCNICHDGGVLPTVDLSGPVSVEVGTTHTYTLTVTSHSPISQRFAGLDVSATSGLLSATQPGTTTMLNSLSRPEITHTAPIANALGGVAEIEFDWTAPLSAGTFTLYGAGNSVNGSQGSNGDAAAAVSLTIAVGSGASTPGESSGPGLSQMLVEHHDPSTGEISLTYDSACDATDNAIHYGPLADVAIHGWSGSDCGIGTGGSYSAFDPGGGSFFFVVVGNDGTSEGSYGRIVPASGPPIERPDYAANSCAVIQDLRNSCEVP